MAAKIFIDSVKVPAISSISISRSASEFVSSASFETPLDYLSAAQDMADVAIYVDGATYFLGLISSYSLSYQGKALSLSVECSDYAYKLSHSLLPLTDSEAATLVYGSTSTAAMSGRLTFQDTVYDTDGTTVLTARVKAGDAIEALLTGTGIIHTLTDDNSGTHEFIGLRTTPLPDTCLVFDPGTTRLEVIEAICEELGAVFYIKFIGKYSVGVFNTVANLSSSSDNADFTTTITVTDSTHLITSLGVDSVPEMICNRVTEEVAYDDATATHAEAASSGASLPYYDKFISIDPDASTVLSTDTAAKLAQYAACLECATISMIGAPVCMYNRLDLSAIYAAIGVTPTISTWRVTETDITISSGAIQTNATLVSPAVTLTDSETATATGSYSIADQIATATASAVDSAAARVATVTELDEEGKTVSVQYAGGGETETMLDRSV